MKIARGLGVVKILSCLSFRKSCFYLCHKGCTFSVFSLSACFYLIFTLHFVILFLNNFPQTILSYVTAIMALVFIVLFSTQDTFGWSWFLLIACPIILKRSLREIMTLYSCHTVYLLPLGSHFLICQYRK